MNKADRYVSIVLLGIAGLWTFLTFQIRATALPGAPGPRFFPLVVIAALTIVSLLLLGSSFKRGSGNAPVKKVKQDAKTADIVALDAQAGVQKDGVCEEYEDPKPVPAKILYSFVAIFLYVVATGFAGFYISTVLFVFIIMKFIMGMHSWIKSVVATVVITGVIYIIFTVFFKLSLPSGSLW